MEEFQKAFDKGMEKTAELKENIKNVAYYDKDSITGLILAFPSSGESAKPTSKKMLEIITLCKFLSIIWVNSEIIKN